MPEQLRGEVRSMLNELPPAPPMPEQRDGRAQRWQLDWRSDGYRETIESAAAMADRLRVGLQTWRNRWAMRKADFVTLTLAHPKTGEDDIVEVSRLA